MQVLTIKTANAAFNAPNGEYAWRLEDCRTVISELASSNCAILGGELWLVDGQSRIHATPPNPQGIPTVIQWSIERNEGEPWPDFVRRSADRARSEVAALNPDSDLGQPLSGVPYVNLTWVDEAEFAVLQSHADVAESDA